MCEIKKIDSIKNMAVFHDFSWRLSVKDEGNNIAEFKKINIIYGRNYSGKTTLSRIFRAIETGDISDKYVSPEFQLSLNNNTYITRDSLIDHRQVIRVFNKDFVKENLPFIVDDEHAINPFAILGENNAKLEKEIEKHLVELGKEEEKSGLIGKRFETAKSYQSAKNEHDRTLSNLENKLRNKANNIETGIKHNKLFGDANYDISKIKRDIVTANSYTQITPEQASEFHDLLKEEPKKDIPESAPFNLKYSLLVVEAKDIIEKNIQASNPIQELLNDTILATWVRNGREHHEGKRNKCAFCGGDLTSELWEKLDKHFNKESEELLSAIERLMGSIKTEKNRITNLLNIKISDFYSNLISSLETLEGQFATQSTVYCSTLDSIMQQLEERRRNIFKSFTFKEPTFAERDLNAIRNSYEKLRNKSNDTTRRLDADQSKAREALRLHEVSTFITDIKYDDECKCIETLKKNMGEAESAKTQAKTEVVKREDTIRELKAQLKDESKGASMVNYYLNNFFGHQSLSLKAIEEPSETASVGYRFEVIRNGHKAFHLSEGECSLIAFCYFIAKLDDVETKGKQPIIWIDDPVSSLDSNHIFFVHSLIDAKIVTPEKYDDNGKTKERERFKQLFISTHNLDFLRYLKRLPGASNKKKSQYFTINLANQVSDIVLMPKYLRNYVTEFNYLFNQIHKCASMEKVDDKNHTTFYNFGNNARKFLEIYLYYKYPDQGMNNETLRYFFGEDKVPAVLTDRINNEYSHLVAAVERGSTPIEVPEMQKAASFILKKIEEKDPDQYSALLQSIGVTEKLPEEPTITVREDI